MGHASKCKKVQIKKKVNRDTKTLKTSVSGGSAAQVVELEKQARFKKDLYGIFG
jgi:hypothetical protein